jgi:hypothetical protein
MIRTHHNLLAHCEDRTIGNCEKITLQQHPTVYYDVHNIVRMYYRAGMRK